MRSGSGSRARSRAPRRCSRTRSSSRTRSRRSSWPSARSSSATAASSTRSAEPTGRGRVRKRHQRPRGRLRGASRGPPGRFPGVRRPAVTDDRTIRWLESLSPWPAEFGLDRMRALLERLADPQRRFPAIHVVGTNGKSTTTLMTAALLRAEGLRVGAYVSPHVRGWHERLDTDPATFERAVARVRPAAREVGATQFEVLTAAALAQFAADEADVAVVEAGLGGRLDATNVLDARVVHLTNVALEHTDVLGETREQIAREKLD